MIKPMRMRQAWHVMHIQKIINSYRISVGKLAGNTTFRRPRHRWEDNIQMCLRKIKLKGVHWIHLHLEMDQWQSLANS
jgi:hypothetical protein